MRLMPAFLLAAAIPGLVPAIPAAASPAAPPAPAFAPPFAPGQTTDTIQGQVIADPWRALEDGKDPVVKAWTAAENARTRAWLDALPDRAALAGKIGRLIRATSPSFSHLVARGSVIFAMRFDPALQQPQLVTLAPSAAPESRKVVLDPNLLPPAGHVSIDWSVPSPDGRLVAVSLSVNGSEDGTLHVYEIGSGREVIAPITRVQYPTGGGSLAWAGDGSGFWYTRYPAEQHVDMQVYWHDLKRTGPDRLVLGTAQGLPPTAEVFLSNDEAGATALASVQLGDGGQWQHFVLHGKTAQQIGRYEDRVIGGAVIAHDGTVYAVSRLGAPKGRVVRLAPPWRGGLAAAATIVPERDDAAVIDGGEFQSPLVLAGDHLLVQRIAGGPSMVTAYRRDGSQPAELAIPPLSAVRELAPLPGGDVLADVTSYVEPAHFLRWSAADATLHPTALAVQSSTRYDDASVTRIFASSKDGTRVPVTVIARKGLALDGSHPLLLYGYGGYGINLVPTFSSWLARLWLDAGGVYAIANLRGGGEYGETWREQGRLTAKQNVFDDFAASARALIAAGYTAPAHLAFMGGSNGGLLMGAEITQHPDLARAVVSRVGIYDMMRVELDPNGAFNVSEFGSVRDPAQFAALRAYSPYHHVVPGTAYPAVLMTTGDNDGRVNPYHSRKFTAALQAATTSGHPILLRTSQNAGHGMGSSLDDTIAENADVLAFLFDQLGMDSAAAAR